MTTFISKISTSCCFFTVDLDLDTLHLYGCTGPSFFTRLDFVPHLHEQIIKH